MRTLILIIIIFININNISFAKNYSPPDEMYYKIINRGKIIHTWTFQYPNRIYSTIIFYNYLKDIYKCEFVSNIYETQKLITICQDWRD